MGRDDVRTVIFDLDGTLADTGGDLIAAANACFTALGHPAPLNAETDKATAFRGGKAMLRLGFSRVSQDWGDSDVDAQYQPLLDHYRAHIDRYTTLYPGVETALADLRTAGYRIGVCTNKPEGLADLLLRRLGAFDWFGCLIGADTLPVRKPDPAPLLAAIDRLGGTPARAILVGDTKTDRDTASAAGVSSVLVTFGPEGDGVLSLAPEASIANYGELGDVVAWLIG